MSTKFLTSFMTKCFLAKLELSGQNHLFYDMLQIPFLPLLQGYRVLHFQTSYLITPPSIPCSLYLDLPSPLPSPFPSLSSPFYPPSFFPNISPTSLPPSPAPSTLIYLHHYPLRFLHSAPLFTLPPFSPTFYPPPSLHPLLPLP